VRYPKWFLLLVAVLDPILRTNELSGQIAREAGDLVRLQRCVRRSSHCVSRFCISPVLCCVTYVKICFRASISVSFVLESVTGES
jgi:hypothetical protein